MPAFTAWPAACAQPPPPAKLPSEQKPTLHLFGTWSTARGPIKGTGLPAARQTIIRRLVASFVPHFLPPKIDGASGFALIAKSPSSSGLFQGISKSITFRHLDTRLRQKS